MARNETSGFLLQDLVSWFLLTEQTQTLLGSPALKGAHEQHAANCLMATYTHCVPGAGVVSMAWRGSEHISTMLDWAEPTDKATVIILAMTC